MALPRCVVQDGKIYLHQDSFASLRLFVDRHHCRVRVTEGHRGDAYDDDSIEHDGTGQLYTYVAVWFDEARFRMESRQHGPQMHATRWPHHVSLAYLPWMPPSERDALATSLGDLLDDWWTTAPEVRPNSLLSSRRFFVGTHSPDNNSSYRPNPSYVWSPTPVYDFDTLDFIREEWSDIKELLDEGRILFVNVPIELADSMEVNAANEVTRSLMYEFCRKFYERDLHRVQVARAIENTCVPKYWEYGKELPLRGGRVVEGAEMRSLLHYLRELMVHKHGAFHMEPQHDVKLLDVGQWHVTPYTEGIYEQRRGNSFSDAAYAEYVECYRIPGGLLSESSAP